MCEIVEGVVRHCAFVTKLKIPKLFSWCSFAKIYAHEISRYTVAGDTLCMTCMKALQKINNTHTYTACYCMIHTEWKPI